MGNIFSFGFKPIAAICYLSPNGTANTRENANGWVFLRQETPEICYIETWVRGLSPGDHGFHIHKGNDLTRGCDSLCEHFNPFNSPHGNYTDPPHLRHVGDLGNITAGPTGIAIRFWRDSLIKLYGEHSVIGRSFVVHEDYDDLGRGGNEESTKTGNAGKRILCGIIERL